MKLSEFQIADLLSNQNHRGTSFYTAFDSAGAGNGSVSLHDARGFQSSVAHWGFRVNLPHVTGCSRRLFRYLGSSSQAGSEAVIGSGADASNRALRRFSQSPTTMITARVA